MSNYKTPGVYIEEVSLLPPSVAQVETAIPAFIGYTAIRSSAKPVRIKSMVEYIEHFGGAAKTLPKFIIAENNGIKSITPETAIKPTPDYRLFYSLQHYFANGGGPCYVASAGIYQATPAATFAELNAALNEFKKEDEPTLLVFADAGMLSDVDQYHNLYINALQQSADLQDRFTICDVLPAGDDIDAAALAFRNKIGSSNLKYGAAYYPNLLTTLGYHYKESEIVVNLDGDDIKLRYQENELNTSVEAVKENSLFHVDNEAYFTIRKMIDEVSLVLPPSAAMAGIYASVDNSRGVWKAPANISLRAVKKPTIVISHEDQRSLNIHETGKSINALRFFTGKGNLVWGARTLAGNDNEWKYISVRRFYNMVEESVKKASEAFVFEPNDANTWVKVKAMIENFLTLQWRAGALMGATTDQAFFVKVGLGETMSSLDVLEGRMIIEIGMGVVRPAEFIILRFSHKLMEA